MSWCCLTSWVLYNFFPSVRCRVGEELSSIWRLLFFLLIMSFSLQKLLSFMRNNSLIVDLSTWAILFMFWTWSPLKWVQAYFPFSVLLNSVYSVLCCILWCIWMWVLCRMITLDLFVFSICRHQLSPAPYVEETFIFSTAWSCLFYQKWCIHRFVCLCQGIPLPITGSLYYYYSVVDVEVRGGGKSRSYFIIK